MPKYNGGSGGGGVVGINTSSRAAFPTASRTSLLLKKFTNMILLNERYEH
jgi:hypothetical protein